MKTEQSRRLLFLSYSTREEEVQYLKAILDPFLVMLPHYTWEKLGVWYDAVDIRHPEGPASYLERKHSDEWLEHKIVKGLNDCDFTLAMLSPHYLRSGWCKFEWNKSKEIHAHPQLLPACWKKTKYSRDFARWTKPYKVHWIDLWEFRPEDAAKILLIEVVKFAAHHRF
jgi:hypothetical protein